MTTTRGAHAPLHRLLPLHTLHTPALLEDDVPTPQTHAHAHEDDDEDDAPTPQTHAHAHAAAPKPAALNLQP